MDKYEHHGTWRESLGVFLYSQLIYENKNVDEVSIKDYDTFELLDYYIQAYNQWLESDHEGVIKIKTWIEQNEAEFNDFKENFGTDYKPKVELWSDREKTHYYKQKLQDSFEFENYIAELIMQKFDMDLGQYLTPEGQYDLGENNLGIEIKNDTLIQKYGNLYIEYAEKSKPGNSKYVNSGILKKDNTKYFLIGTVDEFWIFRKSRLVEIYQEEMKQQNNGTKSRRGIIFKQKPTSLGFVFPTKHTAKEVISLEQMMNEIKAERD